MLKELSTDLLVKIKPNLSRTNHPGPDSSLVKDLFELSALAEKLVLLRPRPSSEWQTVADALDREGTYLWNESSAVRPGLDDQITAVVAALLIHMLQLASKAGTTLADVGKVEVAASVLGSAAKVRKSANFYRPRRPELRSCHSRLKYEECLRSIEDPQGAHQQSRAQATIVYYCSRMEAAWKEGNDSLADYMLQNITDDNERLALLPARDRELLAAKLLDIGRSLLAGKARNNAASSEDMKAQEAVKWMQKAFSIAEQLDDMVTAGSMELKRSILRNLSRAYVLSSAQDPENLSRAETSLNELLTSVDATDDQGNSEYQELRWGMVAVLKRREAGDPALLGAFTSIIDHMKFTEDNVVEILRDVKTLVQRQSLVADILQHCLQHILTRTDRAEPSFVEHFLSALIFHCSKDDNHGRAIQRLKTAFDLIHSAEFDLLKEHATACAMLLWQSGERRFGLKRYSEAADWFLAGTHRCFNNIAQASISKCYRKAALCHIQQHEYAKASNVIRRCPGNEAPTCYVMLLVAVKQGLEDEAIQAVRIMVQAPDFDRKMLLLATRLAHESDLKTLLLNVLQELLKFVQGSDGIDTSEEAITLIRCIIRLDLRLMAVPLADKQVTPLVDAVIEHFAIANALVSSAYSKKKAAAILKDVSWLWRTAYNCAIEGCSDWNDAERKTPILFDIVIELLEAYSETQAPLNEVGEDIYLCMAFASFAAISGRGDVKVPLTARTLSEYDMHAVFAMRKGLPEVDADQLRSLAQVIQAYEVRIRNVLDKAPFQDTNLSRVLSCLAAVYVFECEVTCHMKEWAQLPQIIERAVRADSSNVDALEAIADLLGIIHASLDRNALSVSKFSRWLRALSTVLLSRNTAPDRLKAIGYIEQAISVLEDNAGAADGSDEVYPVDERYWLIATSYNTGIECLHVSLLDEAKRWFEASTLICRYVPDGESKAATVAETYQHLLNRYTS
ncbi:hypothetical protein EVG20_g7223 [Dentipellis fragilis]|uniref:Protein ZIP4 homolog n=1 Tax=Dentipellis fragilis TaxID=205917 RepID=A0A4Y9YJ54_9AGAM|nr:hypothetical protein EVG20_g7223 [Dentipellis fragilis]